MRSHLSAHRPVLSLPTRNVEGTRATYILRMGSIGPHHRCHLLGRLSLLTTPGKGEILYTDLGPQGSTYLWPTGFPCIRGLVEPCIQGYGP